MGVPIIRTIVFWGLYWGPLILGNYHIGPHMSYSLNSLNGLYRKLYRGVLQGTFRGILGVWTIARIGPNIGYRVEGCSSVDGI